MTITAEELSEYQDLQDQAFRFDTGVVIGHTRFGNLLDTIESLISRNAELEEKQRLIYICQGKGLEYRIAAEKRAEKAEAELAALAAQKPFMFGIINPSGEPYMDEMCVASDPGVLEDAVWDLNDGLADNEPKSRVIPLFTRAAPSAVIGLHPSTQKLVNDFAQALGEKLLKAEQKYGYSDAWSARDWQEKCLADFHHHIAKGDPRDVAAYCAFMWHHGWSTAPAGVVVPDARATVRADHADWSQQTFGNVGPIGPLKHLSKEALETAEAVDDLSEWADMQFLLWDAQRRAGISDDAITQAMIDKLAVNKARSWPEPKDGEPRLHIKGGAK